MIISSSYLLRHNPLLKMFASTSASTSTSTLLGVSNDDFTSYIEVLDNVVEENLVLYHYKKNLSDEVLHRVGHVRGLIVDTAANAIVCGSFGHTFELDSIPADCVSIRPAKNGTVVRIFKHNGVVYHSTHRCIDFYKSFWGTFPSIGALYEHLGGPQDYEFFPNDCLYSPVCHFVMLMHPSVSLGTRDQVEGIVYLGNKMMWSVDPLLCPFAQTDKDYVEYDGVASDGKMAYYISAKVCVPDGMHHPPYLTHDAATRYLETGFYGKHVNDSRLDAGEAVMVFDSHGHINRVSSKSYSWRMSIRGNQANLFHQFVCLTSDAVHLTENAYRAKYPFVMPAEGINMTVIGGKHMICPYPARAEYPKTVHERLNNIWLCFLYAIPVSYQGEVIGYMKRFQTARQKLVAHIIDVYYGKAVPSTENAKRVNEIVAASVKYAKTLQANGKLRDCPFNLQVEGSILHLVQREFGVSLYRLFK